jgi:peptidyl-prolyl cis-trans isomerase B (cyclophilin B)
MRLGTYVLYAVPPGKTTAEFVGTPLVIQLRGDMRPGAPSGAIVVKVEPLSVAEIDTTAGLMRTVFYYDVAPNTVSNFIQLANGGFYDGLLFHRVVPDFVIQTGDPLGDSSGGPGYAIDAEFNGRLHLRGVMSMARESDPMESQGAMPRPDFANSAGSQFFICLDYEKTKRLDRKYTAFGQIFAGDETLQKIGSGEIADTTTGRPKEPVKINSIRIVPVKAGDDPYPTLLERTSEPE